MNELRTQLQNLNQEYLSLIQKRKEISQRIQNEKAQAGLKSSFDSEREKFIFNELKNYLKNLDPKELLSFSLLMENHAQNVDGMHYPSWSEGIHMAKAPNSIFEQINPVLLNVIRPEIYSELDINQEYSKYC